MSEIDGLVEALPPLHRLALAYAPSRTRNQTLALLSLDRRLADIVRHSHEPMLAQLRLAWWRELLNADSDGWPSGEPLLALLKSWSGQHSKLSALVDGWEMLIGPAPLPSNSLTGFAEGRGDAFAALAEIIGAPDDQARVRLLGRAWALADFAGNVADPQEKQMAIGLATSAEAPRVSRKMRVLTVLYGLAQRRLRGLSATSLLATIRLGLLGR